MLTWDDIGKWGRRESDAGATEPAPTTRPDARSGDCPRAGRCFLPAADRAGSRSNCRRRGAARSAIVPEATALFARVSGSLAETAVSARPAQGSAFCRRLGRAAEGSWHLDQHPSRPTFPARGYESWLLDEISAAGVDPRRVTAEITESACSSIRRLWWIASIAFAATGLQIAVDDFGTACGARLPHLIAIGRDQDRPRPHHRHRRRRATACRQGDDPSCARARLKVVIEEVETTGQLALLASGAAIFTRASLAPAP